MFFLLHFIRLRKMLKWCWRHSEWKFVQILILWFLYQVNTISQWLNSLVYWNIPRMFFGLPVFENFLNIFWLLYLWLSCHLFHAWAIISFMWLNRYIILDKRILHFKIIHDCICFFGLNIATSDLVYFIIYCFGIIKFFYLF